MPLIPLKSRGFKMACLNINSLTKHIDKLRIVLSNQCVVILAINETKLDGSICENEVTVEGYNIIRRDRSANRPPFRNLAGNWGEFQILTNR